MCAARSPHPACRRRPPPDAPGPARAGMWSCRALVASQPRLARPLGRMPVPRPGRPQRAIQPPPRPCAWGHPAPRPREVSDRAGRSEQPGRPRVAWPAGPAGLPEGQTGCGGVFSCDNSVSARYGAAKAVTPASLSLTAGNCDGTCCGFVIQDTLLVALPTQLFQQKWLQTPPSSLAR